MSSPHILVVDDEADIRGLLKEILSEEGYEVDVAANAAQARASRARQIPDLVLLDIWMPDVDGITLLREWSAAAEEKAPRRSHFDLSPTADLSLQAAPFGDSLRLFSPARGVPDGKEQTSCVGGER